MGGSRSFRCAALRRRTVTELPLGGAAAGRLGRNGAVMQGGGGRLLPSPAGVLSGLSGIGYPLACLPTCRCLPFFEQV